MSQIYKTGSGGGGSGIQTINGDVGSITGSTVTIFANQAGNNSGASVQLNNEGEPDTLFLNLSDTHNNTFLGVEAGNTSVSGAVNTSVGHGSMLGITSGNANTSLGSNSLNNMQTGSYNVCLGNQSGTFYTSSESSNICLGRTGTVGDSNMLRLGNQGSGIQQQNQCFIAGIAGVTTAQSAVTTIDPSTTQMATVLAGNAGNVLTDDGTNWVSSAPTGGVSGTNAFFAYLSVSTGAVTGDTTTVTVPFDTTLFDNGSNFDTTNHWYLVPTTGIYQFNINGIVTNSGGTNTGLFLELMNGATTYFLGYDVLYNVAGSSGTANASTTIPCTAGDHIFVNLAVNGNATKNVSISGSSASFTSFSGYRVA
jgi:hypothetical protein